MQICLNISPTSLYIHSVSSSAVHRFQVHEDQARGVFIGGLKQEKVATAEDIHSLLASGEGEYSLHAVSLRDYTLFTSFHHVLRVCSLAALRGCLYTLACVVRLLSSPSPFLCSEEHNFSF